MFQLSTVHKEKEKNTAAFSKPGPGICAEHRKMGQCRPQAPGVCLVVPGKKVIDRIGVQQQAATFPELCMV